MATSSTSGLSSAEACQSNFEKAVALSLHMWPALTLAVQNNWGGPDSGDKRDWFAGAVVDLFPTFTKVVSGQAVANGADAPEEPDVEYVETFLLQVMLDEFEVNVDDETGYDVAERIINLRSDASKGKFEAIDDLRKKWESRKGTKVEGLYKRVEDADQDTDWESDDEGEVEGEEDVEMDEAPPLAPVQREKAPAEVDEEGFTKVTKKKR